MNVRLVLASAPVSLEDRYGSFAGVGSTEPSFGLACLAATALQAGASVHIVEASSANMSVSQAAESILRHAPHVVGISATTAGIMAAGALASLLKARNPQLILIIGGCHASAIPGETLAEFPAFDLAVIGEGERTLDDILQAVAATGAVPSRIAGTAERGTAGITKNPPRPPVDDLDTLPLPAWSLLEGFPRAFRPSPARIRRWPCASVVLTRGCPNTCTFCDRSVFGHRCRSYSPAYAVRLLRDLHDTHGVREILIEDDTFVIVKERVREFCDRLLAEKLDLSWSCLGRADRADPELLGLMRKAGCWHISYGIESGDAGILKAVHKNLDVAQMRRAVKWSRDARLRVKGFFMVGFPGETPATLEATRQLALSLPLDDISVMQLTPFPGSELYNTASQHGSFEHDWRRMNALTTVFVPTGLTREQIDAAKTRLLLDFYRRPGVLVEHALESLWHPQTWIHQFRALQALWAASRRPHR